MGLVTLYPLVHLARFGMAEVSWARSQYCMPACQSYILTLNYAKALFFRQLGKHSKPLRTSRVSQSQPRSAPVGTPSHGLALL